MALVTPATVTIEAAPSEVFAWLIDPAKLTTWLGAPGGMPENASELHAGWTGSSTMAAPGRSRPIGVQITITNRRCGCR
jgi:uncharacterized protein YndB with AHSA1/START domain